MQYNRRYLIIPTSIINQIDFNEVLETSAETLRKSIDNTLTFVKYNVVLEDDIIISGRPSIYSEEYKEYNYDEMIEILSTATWSSPIQE
jgi:hypothetical protein